MKLPLFSLFLPSSEKFLCTVDGEQVRNSRLVQVERMSGEHLSTQGTTQTGGGAEAREDYGEKYTLGITGPLRSRIHVTCVVCTRSNQSIF